MHYATLLNISKAHLFCAAATCIAPKSSSSSRLLFRLPEQVEIKEKVERASLSGQPQVFSHPQSVLTYRTFISVSDRFAEQEPQTSGLSSGPVNYHGDPTMNDGERFEGHTAHKQRIYKRGGGGLTWRLPLITPLSCVAKRRGKKGGNGLRRIGRLCDLGWISWAGIGYYTNACKLWRARAEEGRFSQTCHSSLQGEGSAQLHRGHHFDGQLGQVDRFILLKKNRRNTIMTTCMLLWGRSSMCLKECLHWK